MDEAEDLVVYQSYLERGKMIGEHEAGKGSVSRVKDIDRYRKGYDSIKWFSKNKKVKNGRDSSSRARSR